MDQLIAHAPTRLPQDGDVVFEVTDLSLHTKEFAPSSSVGKKLVRALSKNEPTRVYMQTTGDLEVDKLAIQHKIATDPEFTALVQETNATGHKVFFHFPKGGTPIQLGKDTTEFFNSRNGKRVLRGLAKKKTEE